MNTPDQALEYFKVIINQYDFDNGKQHIIKIINGNKKYIEILFVFGRNITARFDYQMGAWFELKSRTKEIHKFYWKDQRTKDWTIDKIKKATTCVCGQLNLKLSDGYPYMENCPYGKTDFRCKAIEINEFSVLVPNYTR